MIDYLEIQNYKMFEKLRLDGLGRVNLIVGKNNVGKSSLLEAVYLATCPRFHRAVYRVLELRKMPIRSKLRWSIENMFGFLDKECRILCGAPDRLRTMQVLGSSSPTFFRTQPEFTGRDDAGSTGWTLPFYPSLLNFLAGEDRPSDDVSEPVLVDSMRLVDKDREATWDLLEAYSRTPLIERALRLIEPHIEKIALIKDDGEAREPYVRLTGRPELQKLSTLGTGSQHLFDVAFALVRSLNSYCLIDEIENGMHYELHEQVCDFIFEVAAKLNVQVFLTTHSLDFTRAFARSAHKSTELGRLYRLTRQLGYLEAVDYTERELLIAAEQEIEVR